MSTSGVFNKGEPLYAGPNGQKVMLPEYKYLYCFAILNPCVWCMISKLKVRGLPRDAVPLGESEKQRLLAKLQGYWKVQPISVGGYYNSFTYTDVHVEGDKMIFSGGMHNQTFTSHSPHSSGHHHHTTTHAVANRPQEQRILPFRGSDGTLYVDNVGSILVREEADNSEIEINNCMDMKLKLVRGWKMEGRSNPNGGNAVSTSNGTSVADEISKLQKLYEDGVLSDEEFRAAKINLIQKM
jgi:hypothetical protein